MKKLTYLLLFSLSLFLYQCKSSKSSTSSTAQLDALQKLMTGSFDSADQAAQDSSYYAISLHMYPIWEGKGHWLYVEQALASRQEQPYRQRVYQLEQVGPNRFASKVYKLENEKDYIGKWREPVFFDRIQPSDLIERTGCAVFLERQSNGQYVGETNAKDCESSLRGAAYATSKVSIKTGMIESWDQGFDANDQQVWGATKGGYIFKQKS